MVRDVGDGEGTEVRRRGGTQGGLDRVEASAPGFASESREIDVTADADFPLRIELALTAVETDTDSDDSGAIIGPAVIMGAGAVGLVIGAATGGAALSTASTLKDRCGDTNPCAREHAPLKDEATTLATASTVSLVVGGVLLAGGATWLVIGLMSGDDGGDPGGDELALDLELNLGGAGLSGRF